MKNTIKRIIVLVLALVLATAVFASCKPNVGKDSATATDPFYDETWGNYSINVYLIIYDVDKEATPLFSGTVELKTTAHMAYEAVEAAATVKGITITGLNGYGSFLSAINGVGYVENADNTYCSWTCTINEKWSPGVGAQQLRDGDLFEVFYGTFEKTW